MCCVQAVDSRHSFTAVLTASSRCPAFGYLRMKLHKQVLAELELLNGSPTIFEAAIRVLDKSWRKMHPFHSDILEGFRGLSMALVDARRQRVFLASYGTSRAACGYRSYSGSHSSVRNTSSNLSQGESLLHVEVVPLKEVSCIITASSGFW